MKTRSYIILAIVMVLTMVLAACGGGEPPNKLEAIKEEGKMIVGTSADYPPYESVDDAGNFVGFDMDLIREIGKRMAVVEVKDMAFDALIAAVQEKKVDTVIAAMQSSPEREEKVDFSEPYHYRKDAFLTAPDSPIVLTKAMDAAGHSIGVQTGTIQEKWVLDNLVVDRGGRIKALFARRRLRIYPPDFGNSTAMVSVPLAEASQAVNSLRSVLGAVGYRGIFSAEFKRDPRDGKFKLLEVNTRPWWFIDFAVRCGVDVCRMAYEDAQGIEVEPVEQPRPAVAAAGRQHHVDATIGGETLQVAEAKLVGPGKAHLPSEAAFARLYLPAAPGEKVRGAVRDPFGQRARRHAVR